jgi:MFS family permease
LSAAMDVPSPYVPLPPPPLQPDRETEPDWQVSWTLVAYMAVAGFLAAVGGRAISGLTHHGTPLAGLSVRMLGGLGHSVLASALLGLGVALAERRCPATWPRTGRWALGAGLGALIGGLIPSPGLFHYYTSSGVALRSMLVSALVGGAIAALMPAFVGFYLARVLRPETDPWRRLPLAGMEAQLIVVGALLAVSVVGMVFAGPSGFQLQMVALTVAQSAVSGLLTGCAFAAGLRRADREAPAVYG